MLSEYFFVIDDAIGDAGESSDGIFDFAELNPQAADFDLMIFAAEIFDIAVRQPARDVARAINRVRLGRRDVRENVRGELRIVQITARQADACQAKFAGFADVRLLSVLDDIGADVLNRAADGNAFEIILWRAVKIGHIHCGLGGAIEIGEPCRR